MDKDLLQSRTLKHITYRYIFAVGLIAILALTTFLYNQHMQEKKFEDYQIINLTGRQRMLSQRIALMATNGHQKEIGKSMREFHNGLNYLKSTRFVSQNYPEIHSIYSGIEEMGDKLVLLATSPMTKDNKKELIDLSQALLKKFDRATLLTQKTSEEEHRDSFQLESIFVGTTLILLLLEVVFIFRPMTNEVRQTFNELNEMEDKSVDSARLALIGHTAATIGHEIKNPLFAILAYSRFTGEGDEIKLTKIHKNAEKIRKIIDALSIQARESSHDEKVASSLKTIIDDALDVLNPRIKASNIKIFCDEKFQGNIVCRPAAISQVVANLLANAADAVQDLKGEKSIRIETGADSDNIYVRVSDNGQGVPPELREEIFKTFMTTKKQGVGSGLGLSFCRKIMHEHEGELELRTDLGPSCFEMRFPLYLSVRV